jgi:shikimate kinase
MLVKGFKQFNEERVKSVTFTFGRFNPPTVGHGKLLDKVASLSTGNDYKVFASKSNDAKKNPLEYSEKIKIMRKMFPKHGRNIVNDKSASILHAASSLYSQGYTKAKLVVGSDRIKEMSSLLNKYNGVKSKHGFYDFEGGIEVVSAGDRDPDADDVSGMSASKMRAAAVSGDFQAFSNGLPKSFGDKLSVFNLLRKRMGLKEMVNFRKHVQLPTVSEKRERFISGEIFNVGDRVQCQKSNQNFTISERYSNYVVSAIGTKYFINDLEEYSEETVNPKYHAGLSKSTKAKRKAQFKKQAKMDDDNPAAYKPAPGDARAETKPSKYTKRFKDMFGEEYIEEGVDDPAIFKAIFLAGGPGSGKSFTVGKTGLTALGFKIVNSDDKFEAAMKKADLEPTPNNIFSPKGQKLRSRAKELTAKQQELYLNGRLGLVVDGTGKDYDKIKKQSELLKKLGYDVAMIFVNTDLETAQVRNRMRPRSLPNDQVAKMWQGVQNNLGKFQSMFGSNFIIVDNSEGSNIEKATISAYKKMAKFAKEAPKNNIARGWIKKQLGEETEILISENKKGIENKAKATGISYSILKKVFDRGVAAWRTGHRPGTTPSQWGFARINSFATGGKTRTTADKDLWAQHKGKKESIEESKDFEPHWMYDPETGEKEWAKVKADHDRLNKKGWSHEPNEALDYGTPETTKNFKRNTPGQKIEEGEGKYKGETWEQGYKRRVVKTSDPDHVEKGYKWRIKGKERPEISIKLYKEKPSFKEYSKQMERVAGHEFGK